MRDSSRHPTPHDHSSERPPGSTAPSTSGSVNGSASLEAVDVPTPERPHNARSMPAASPAPELAPSGPDRDLHEPFACRGANVVSSSRPAPASRPSPLLASPLSPRVTQIPDPHPAIPEASSSRVLPAYRPPMTTYPEELSLGGLKPADVLPLFACAHCASLLQGPVTLRCGHTVCSTHVQSDISERSVPLSRTTTGSSSTAVRTLPTRTSLSNLPSCPVDTCALSFASHRSPHLTTMPPSSRVSYYPPSSSTLGDAAASSLSISSTSTGSSGYSKMTGLPKKVASPKLDTTIGKVQQLTTSWVHESERRQRAMARSAKSAADTDDDGTDNEEADPSPSALRLPVLQAMPQIAGPAGLPIPTGPARLHTPPTSDPSESVKSSPSTSYHRPKAKRRRTEGPPEGRSSSVSPPARPDSADRRYALELFIELQCEICFSLLYNPVTTPCQHTFCSKCLSRTLDHSNQCPLCRQDLSGFAYFHEQAYNKVVQSLIVHAFPDVLADRKATIEEDERNARLDTPIFVSQLSFPGLPTILHVFEPRYRLMVRRCLQTADPTFGMVMPPRTNVLACADAAEYGTMLEIQSVQMLPDGRSMVETRGTYRFRILERGTLDGYVVAKIERIEDCPPEIEELLEQVLATPRPRTPNGSPFSTSIPEDPEPSIEDLMRTCREFYEQLKSGTAPWVVQQMNNAYGAMPDDPPTFSFWMAVLLPIDDNEKAKLIPIRSPRLRLRLLVHWIESLNNSWWFGQGCQIM